MECYIEYIVKVNDFSEYSHGEPSPQKCLRGNVRFLNIYQLCHCIGAQSLSCLSLKSYGET
jgi:hypothetical protein